MNQKCIEHITLYSLVLVGTLVVGVLVRQYVLSKGVDDFSSSVAFFATVIVLDVYKRQGLATTTHRVTKSLALSRLSVIPVSYTHLLDHLHLDQVKRPAIITETHPVCRDLKTIFKKR